MFYRNWLYSAFTIFERYQRTGIAVNEQVIEMRDGCVVLDYKGMGQVGVSTDEYFVQS